MDLDATFLTCIRVVAREFPSIQPLAHVLQLLDEFLFPEKRLKLPRCVQYRSPRLFSRILKSLDGDATRSKLEKKQQYRLASTAAARLGQLFMVQQLHLRSPTALNADGAVAAGESGELMLLQWIHRLKGVLLVVRGCAAVLKAYEVSAGNGDLATVQWLVTTFPSAVVDVAVPVKSGQLQVARWVLEHAEYQRGDGMADAAAMAGDRDMMTFLLENDMAEKVNQALDLAAAAGHLAFAKWLKGQEAYTGKFSTLAMDSAAGHGHLEVLQWLHGTEQVGCTTDAMDLAAEFGHLDVLQWLRENTTEGCTERAMDKAAMNGHLEVVRWLAASEVADCTTNAMDWAAKAGKLEVVRWLHRNRTEGCTELAMDQAAANGHLQVVRFLRANRTEGCTKLALSSAAGSGDLRMVQWLVANSSEGDVSEAIACAARNGHLEVVKVLHPVYSDSPSARRGGVIDAAAMGGHLRVVEWLCERGGEQCSPITMACAAQNCHFEVVKWLDAHRALSCPKYALTSAFATGNFEMLEFSRTTMQWDRYAFAVVRAVAMKNQQTEVMQWLSENFSEVR